MSKINKISPLQEKDLSKPRILVVPLDWGLGHATRCVPVIYELIALNADVWLAGEGAQRALLEQEFPGLPFLPLKGYRVKYGRSSGGLLRSIFFQVPRLLKSIRNEHEWLLQAVDEHRFDAIISDNRFGLYHPTVHSVFITHQLNIKSPLGKWSERLLQKNNYRYIDRFDECWVPDEKGPNNLAGNLSHPESMPEVPVHYIGGLSRLKKTGEDQRKGHLFISLSGPEPQRTMLENVVIDEISHYNGTATVVRGLPGSSSIIPSTNDIRFYNHLSTEDYSKEMERAEYVISRSGYSTIMDLMKLGKKSILIPTPGQTEQEYLGKYLMSVKKCYCVLQNKFRLNEALKEAKVFSYDITGNSWTNRLGERVSSLINFSRRRGDATGL
jgi:UDP-N-acetylglucosamine transferase subunit ALG13